MSAFGVHVDQENQLNAREGKGSQALQKRPVLGIINTNTTKIQTRRNDGKSGLQEKPAAKSAFTVHVDDASDKDRAPPKAAGGLVLRGGKKLDTLKAKNVAETTKGLKFPIAAQPTNALKSSIPTATVTSAVPKEEKLNLSSITTVPRQPLKDLSVVAAREEEPMSEDSIVESPMNVDRSLILSPISPVLKAKAKTKVICRSNIFELAEYRDEIYSYLRKAEMRSRAKPYYMRRQPDVSYSMRSVLVDWLVEVTEEYKLQNETLYLGVSFIDRFLSQMSVVRAKLQLLGTAAMFIASKYEEVYPPDVSEFVFITDDTYSKTQVLKMEHVILRVLTFDLSIPTTLAFLNHLYVVCSLPEKTLHLAMYLCELSLLEGDPYLMFRQSVIASSAIAVARHCLEEDETWPKELAEASGYTLKDLNACIINLNDTHAKAEALAQQAVNDKYKANKWHNVSEISPRQLIIEDD